MVTENWKIRFSIAKSFRLIAEHAHLFAGEVEMGNPNRGTLVMVNIPLNLSGGSL